MNMVKRLFVCLLAFSTLCGCEQADVDYLDDSSIIEMPEIVETNFDNYEDILKAYQLSESRKKELLTQMVELFLASNPEDLCNEAYATYFGNIGRALLKEYEIFKSIKYSGKGSADIPNNVENYDVYFENNKYCHMVGNLLLKIEKDLKDGKTKQILDDLNKVYEYIDVFKEVGENNETN